MNLDMAQIVDSISNHLKTSGDISQSPQHTADCLAARQVIDMLATRVARLETALYPFLQDRGVIRYGALSRGVWRKYEKHMRLALEILNDDGDHGPSPSLEDE